MFKECKFIAHDHDCRWCVYKEVEYGLSPCGDCYRTYKRRKDENASCFYRYRGVWELPTKNHRKNYNRKKAMRRVQKAYNILQWRKKLEATGGVCPRCKKHVGVENLTLDHIIPVSKAKPGTVYTIDDIQALCKDCNVEKADKIETLPMPCVVDLPYTKRQ